MCEVEEQEGLKENCGTEILTWNPATVRIMWEHTLWNDLEDNDLSPLKNGEALNRLCGIVSHGFIDNNSIP